MTLSPAEYMDLLLARREEYYAEHGQPRPGFPALPEWFIRDGDEHLVDMDAIEQANRAEQPRPERKPRTYKPASHWREVLERIDARLAALDPGPRHGTTDPAAYGGIGIRQTARQQRAWGERIDRTAAEYVRLTRLREELRGKLWRAEERERQTRAEVATTPGLTCHNRGSATNTKTPASAGTDRGRGPTEKESSVTSVPTSPGTRRPGRPQRTKPITEDQASRLYPTIMRKTVELPNGCINRTVAIHPKTGYSNACLKIDGKYRYFLAHRVVWTYLRGPIPPGMTIDHLCNNRTCVNVEHMEVVSQRENVLRSDNPAARNARKTRCKSGHMLPPLALGETRRECVECTRGGDQ